MKSVVIGASAGLGLAIARRLAAKGHELFLVSSDPLDLNSVVKDLRIRFHEGINGHPCNLKAPDLTALEAAIRDKLGRIDNLFLIAGQFAEDQDRAPCEEEILENLVAVNFLSPVKIANRFYPDLVESRNGNIVGIGSIAAIRGRSNAMAYASSKRALEFYFQALRHLLTNSNCKAQFYRAGYLDTSMTRGKRLLLPKYSAEAAAEAVVRNLGKDIELKYLPGWWKIVGTLLNWLPWCLFKRLKF